MKINQYEYKCECCGEKFKTGAIIPNRAENKKIALCTDCYTDIEVMIMIHEPITKYIKILKEKTNKQNNKKEANQ